MLICMLYSFIYLDEGGHEEEKSSLAVLIVKLPCAIALHLSLYPEVRKGMVIMKFANNQPEQFMDSGSEISFVIGFL